MPIRNKLLFGCYKRTCELADRLDCCKGSDQIHRHHIMRGIYRHDAVWNLICVCERCHQWLHDINRFTWQEAQVACWHWKMCCGEFDHEAITQNFRCDVRDYIRESQRTGLIVNPRCVAWADDLLKMNSV